MTDEPRGSPESPSELEHEIEPPWAHLPELPYGSMGWRMGTGEDYLRRWFAFVRTVPDHRALLRYLRRHPPAPHRWRNPLLECLDQAISRSAPPPPISPSSEDPRSAPSSLALDAAFVYLESLGARRAGLPEEHEADKIVRAFHIAKRERALFGLLLDEKLVERDVAYRTFLLNVEARGGMTAPWRWPDPCPDPDEGMRFRPRELGWWTRWLRYECRDLAHHLTAHPPPVAWAPVVSELRAGRDQPWATLHGGALAFLPSMVANSGLLPPPWAAGYAPPATNAPPPMPGEPELPSSPPITNDARARWAHWAGETFDDAASWKDYLKLWPPTTHWEKTLARDDRFSMLK